MPTREDRSARRTRNRPGTPTRTARRRPVDPTDELTAGAGDGTEEPVSVLAEGPAEDRAEEPAEAREAAPPDAEEQIDDPEQADAPEQADEPGHIAEHAGRAARRRPNALTALLVVLLAGALAAAGVFGHRWYADRQLDAAHQAAVAAARQTTVNFVSVSAASVDRDLQRITAGATGEFKDQFTQGQAQVRAAVVENKVDSRGTVLRAALVSGDRDHAVVLVAVDATVKNVKTPDGRPSHYRIQVDMARDRHSGRWLVARLQFVG